tara:strand:- start:1337 stop:1675 length:339 start_codon:yes stop_codon:yes gene_type:complete
VFEITENDYTYVENEQSIVQGVKYKSGPYKDVIVMYGTVSIKEDEDLDVARLGFTFQIADPAEFTVEELEKEEAFKNYMGDVLRHIIINNLDNKKARIGNIESEQSTPDTHT